MTLFNARSVANKLPELHQMLYSVNKTCCYCITETWLNDRLSNGLLDPQAMFTIFRDDRQRSRGGGVCLFINKAVTAVRVDLHDKPPNIDMLCVDLLLGERYRVFVVYRPPATDHDNDVNMTQLISCLERYMNHYGPTIILGDFNCPNINWLTMLRPTEYVSQKLFDFAVCNGFIQCIRDPTRGDSILDLLLINDPLLLSNVEVTEPFSSSDHCIINADFVYDTLVQHGSLPSNSTIKRYNWKDGDYVAMSDYLRSVDWDKLNDRQHVECIPSRH